LLMVGGDKPPRPIPLNRIGPAVDRGWLQMHQLRDGMSPAALTDDVSRDIFHAAIIFYLAYYAIVKLRISHFIQVA